MKHRSILFLTLGVLILVGLFILLKPQQTTQTNNPEIQAPTGSSPNTLEISLLPDVFQPGLVTIKKGTKVIFKNADTVARWPASDLHPTHEIYPEFDPKKPVEVGTSWEFIFDRVGNWKYHDHLNPSIRGEIDVVEEGIQSTPTPVVENIKTINVVVKDKKIVGDNVFKVIQGETIEFKIICDMDEEFHLHGYDKSVELKKDQQASLKLNAELTGRFEIELENSKTEIATLEVSPK